MTHPQPADEKTPYQAGIDRLVSGNARYTWEPDQAAALTLRVRARRQRELEFLRLQRAMANACVECGAALVDMPWCPACGRAREEDAE